MARGRKPQAKPEENEFEAEKPKTEYQEYMEKWESKDKKKSLESSIEQSDYQEHPKFAKFKK